MRNARVRTDDQGSVRSAACLVLLLMGTAWALAPGMPPGALNVGLARFLFIRQDLPLALAMLVAVMVALGPRAEHTARGLGARIAPRDFAVAVATLVPFGCWIGARIVFGRYDLSRDEQMADFDAAIFATGRLFAAFPQQLRSSAALFNQTFILPIGNHEAWVSAYLPMNAAARAVFLRLGDASLTGPFFVGLGGIAIWRIGAKLWPRSPDSQVATLLLYAGSSQVWMMGMTAYAMSAHLGLNLLWLWLFLEDRRSTHAAALAVGFVATGLHQPLFHPLFVLPFLMMLVAEKRRRLLLVYVAAYAAIALFWLGWPLWISAHGIAPAAPSPDLSGIGFGERFMNAVSGLHGWGIGVMAANLVRFFAWQHLLMAPLAAYGIRRCWNLDPIARALALGLVLPIGTLLILLPYQGHGWGYRYLHGVIGNACLLGGYGWRQLEERRRAPTLAMTVASGISIAILLPIHAAMAHRLVAPFAAVAARRDATPARFVIVDDLAAPFAQDLAINRPDLSNRPLILVGHALDAGQVASLCREGTVAFLDAPQLVPLATTFGAARPEPSPAYARLEGAARSAGCGRVALPD